MRLHKSGALTCSSHSAVQDTSVRFAGHAYFPRQLPAPEGKPLLDTDVERLVSPSVLTWILMCFCPHCSRHLSMWPVLNAGPEDVLVMNNSSI